MAASVSAVRHGVAHCAALVVLFTSHVAPGPTVQVRDAINSGHPLPNTMRKRPGEVSDDSDEELDMDDQPLVPMEKAIVGFFFAGFFMVVLMLVGLTRVSWALCHIHRQAAWLPSRCTYARARVLCGVACSWRSSCFWWFQCLRSGLPSSRTPFRLRQPYLS